MMRPRRGYISFAEEHHRNMESNAHYHGASLPIYLEKSRQALSAYSKAHQRLRVFNAAQLFAREAAVSLGREDFYRTVNFLERLESRLDSPEEWVRHATEYTLTPQGFVKEFP
jgi:hypothetical protein